MNQTAGEGKRASDPSALPKEGVDEANGISV